MEHSRLSPSKRFRWSKCPASITLEEQYPDPPPHEITIEGTHSHTLLQFLITTGFTCGLVIDMAMSDHYGQFTVTEEMAERISHCISYIQNRKSEFPDLVISSEVRFDMGPIFQPKVPIFGTSDVVLVSKENSFLEIIDLKDGFTPVNAKDNPQLELYAISAIHQEGFIPETLVLTIIQPRNVIKGMNIVSNYTMPGTSLYNGPVIDSIKAEVRSALDPTPRIVAGSHCKHCKHSGNCETFTNFSLGNLPIPVDVNKADIPELMANQYASLLPSEELSKIMEAAPMIRYYIDTVEEEVKKRLEGGLGVPGFKLVVGPGSRNWAMDAELISKKLSAMGIPKEAVYVKKLVSPAQVDKLRWRKRDGTMVALSKKQKQLLDSEYISKKSGGLKVVPESDLRDSAVVSVETLFHNIEGEN